MSLSERVKEQSPALDVGGELFKEHNHSHSHRLNRADAHAPISIMSDHVHKRGDVMLSYRYMHMEMDGMRSSDSGVDVSDVFQAGFVSTPTRMTMDGHMFGLMFAPTDWLTLTAMSVYKTLDMDHRIDPRAAPLISLNGGLEEFSVSAQGLGDTRVGGLFKLMEHGGSYLHGGLTFSLPTGNINESAARPGPGGRLVRQLPAAMQLGSGTFDILPSLTYQHQKEHWSLGWQARGAIRTGRNHHGYTFGDEAATDLWFSVLPWDWVSLSLGAGYQWRDNLQGSQTDISTSPPFAPNRKTISTAFGENYGGQRLDASAGVNLMVPSGFLKGHRIAAELRLPVWEDVNGYQLETDWLLTLGWQYAF